jgi:aspartate carbamoyltransferase catalytic subunit
MSELSVEHLISIKDLQVEDLNLIFHTADNFKDILRQPVKKVPSLRDVTIANLFFENSTRTRISFELAEKRLSADVVNFSASSSSVKKGETLLDTVNNILAMKVDMIVMRHPSPGAPVFLSKHIDAQVVNAGDGCHEHPTQAILDAYSIRERCGKIEGLNVLIVGDIMHSRVALSNIHCLIKLGAKVRVCGPPTLIPPHIEALGIEVSYNLEESLVWADVTNVLRIQLERQSNRPGAAAPLNYFPSLREYALHFGIDAELLDRVEDKKGKELVVMHPGPMNRGVEITSEVADSDRAIILDQVENGLATRMAILYLLSAKPGSVRAE